MQRFIDIVMWNVAAGPGLRGAGGTFLYSLDLPTCHHFLIPWVMEALRGHWFDSADTVKSVAESLRRLAEGD